MLGWSCCRSQACCDYIGPPHCSRRESEACALAFPLHLTVPHLFLLDPNICCLHSLFDLSASQRPFDIGHLSDGPLHIPFSTCRWYDRRFRSIHERPRRPSFFRQLNDPNTFRYGRRSAGKLQCLAAECSRVDCGFGDHIETGGRPAAGDTVRDPTSAGGLIIPRATQGEVEVILVEVEQVEEG